MSPEKRIMLSVLLLGVAQQVAANVRWLDSKIITRLDVAADAVQFVASDEFELMCEVIDIDPALLRDTKPNQAMKLFELITSDKKDQNEFN